MFFKVDHLEVISRNWFGLLNPENDRLDKIKYSFGLWLSLISVIAFSVELPFKILAKIYCKNSFQTTKTVTLKHLIVREENPNNYQAIRSQLIHWEQIAKELKKKRFKEVRRFNDSAVICDYIKNKLASLAFSYRFFPPDSLRYERVFTCIGPTPSNNVQAIAIVQKLSILLGGKVRHFMHLNFIGTNPRNIKRINNSYTKGAGTALVFRIAMLCLEGNMEGILLNPFKSAEPFYKKLGFKKVSFLCRARMLLSVQEIQKKTTLWEEKLRTYQENLNSFLT